MLDNITITGITPLESYPHCCVENCRQNIQQVSLCIPCQKPEMQSIDEIKITLCIENFKFLDTILGRKVFINGAIKIRVIYTSKTKEQSLHSAHWEIGFCDFILLQNPHYNECDICLSNFFIALENVCVNYCDEKNIKLSLFYIICANFNNQPKLSNCNYKYNSDYYNSPDYK